MLPERDEWQILRDRFTETNEEEVELDMQLDEDYISFLYLSFLKGDGDDKKRILLMNFDVPAHKELLAQLSAEHQHDTCRIIQWYLDEYARLFPGR